MTIGRCTETGFHCRGEGLDGGLIRHACEWMCTARSRFVQMISLGIAVLSGSCSSLPSCHPTVGEPGRGPKSPELVSYHVIELNADGFLYDLRSGKPKVVITDGRAVQDYLEQTVFKGFRESGKTRMLVFVHGGLNNQQQGMSHFWDDYENILSGNYYPVFVVWPSGWGSTYFEHLFLVRQGLKAESGTEKAFCIATSPFALLADVGRSVTRLPLVIANNSRTDIESVTPARRLSGGAAVLQYQQLVATNYPVSIGDDYSRRSDLFVRGITYWATLPLKYLGASLIDGFGQGAWDDMLRRTQEVYPARVNADVLQHLQNNQTRQGNLQSSPAAASGGPSLRRYFSVRQEMRAQRYAAAGLPIFIEALRQRQEHGTELQEVTLVGHSMGTIILNRVIDDADMQFANIVYMGAACSVADFESTVLPYMRKNPGTQFYNLSLHPVAEDGEINAADVPPRGSLLVWLDNFLTKPVTEQERTLGNWRNLFRSSPTGEPIIRSFYDDLGGADLKGRLHFKAFSVGFGNKDQIRDAGYQWNRQPVPKGIAERCDNPLGHGEFGEMPYWKPEFWWTPPE